MTNHILWGVVSTNDLGVVLLVDKELVDYYYSLIPPYINKQRQKHAPHITIIRRRIEYPPDDFIKGLDGIKLRAEYSPEIQFDGTYFFLPVYSDDIAKFRILAGLSIFRRNFNCYHLTIGNCKNVSSCFK